MVHDQAIHQGPAIGVAIMVPITVETTGALEVATGPTTRAEAGEEVALRTIVLVIRFQASLVHHEAGIDQLITGITAQLGKSQAGMAHDQSAMILDPTGSIVEVVPGTATEVSTHLIVLFSTRVLTFNRSSMVQLARSRRWMA